MVLATIRMISHGRSANDMAPGMTVAFEWYHYCERNEFVVSVSNIS